jgi:integrase
VLRVSECGHRPEAEAFVVRLKHELEEARQQGLPGIVTWQKAVVRYLEEFADKNSLPDDRDHLKKLDPYLRGLKLDAVDMSVLQPFVRDRKTRDGVSNATVNRALEVVRRILNVAHQEWRWLRAVPKLRMLKEPRRRVRFLRREEADRLIEALPAHMKPIVKFALATGGRRGEILGLEWERVDLAPSGLARSRHDEERRGPRHSAQCGRHGGARGDVWSARPLVFHLPGQTDVQQLLGVG